LAVLFAENALFYSKNLHISYKSSILAANLHCKSEVELQKYIVYVPARMPILVSLPT